MKILALCVVRDEADVLPHTLRAALAWAAHIFVWDNGSTDATWSVLAEFARRHPQVELMGRDRGEFRNSMRADLANARLARAEPGDWWCRLDADEIYVADPLRFLSALPGTSGIVYSESIEYMFTDRDLEAWQQEPALYEAHWTPERHRYYVANWSEPRFVRHQNGVEWVGAWPSGYRGFEPAQVRIPLRHFPYRSPAQIQRRVLSRRAVPEEWAFRHEKVSRWVPRGLSDECLAFGAEGTDDAVWRTRVVRASCLTADDGSGSYHVDRALLPDMTFSRPSTSLVGRLLARLARGSGG